MDGDCIRSVELNRPRVSPTLARTERTISPRKWMQQKLRCEGKFLWFLLLLVSTIITLPEQNNAKVTVLMWWFFSPFLPFTNHTLTSCWQNFVRALFCRLQASFRNEGNLVRRIICRTNPPCCLSQSLSLTRPRKIGINHFPELLQEA